MAVAIAGLAMSAYGAYSAGQAQDSANQQNQQNLQQQMAWNRQQDPFSAGGNRAQYVPQLNQLMQGGAAGVASDPLFQKQNQQSQTDMQRQFASQGMGVSGQEMNAMGQNSWQNQQNYFNQQYQKLASLSGASGGGGSAAIGQSPQNVYNQSLGTANQFGQAFGFGANALSSIYGQGGSSGATGDNAGTWNSSMPNQNPTPYG